MRRADRLFQIVQHLRGGRLVTAQKLAERLEVSERTIYRDIADLQSTGVPIDGEAGVGYIMREGFDLPPLMFNREEIVALVAGARMVSAWGGIAMAKAAQEALVKIETVLPDAGKSSLRAIEVRAPHSYMSDADRAKLDAIEKHCADRVELTFAYEDGKGAHTERTVRPLGLWFWGRIWMMITWCTMREDFRVFRVDRMSTLTVNGTHFKQEPGRTLRDFYVQMQAKGEVPPDFDFQAAGF
ncbi:MAG: YafY family protein [Pseudomonadota bacterium]